MVVFRVTQDEYEKLLLACARRGARNVTDFIRSEVLVSVLDHEVPRGEKGYLATIDNKLTRVHSDVQRLLQIVTAQSNQPVNGRDL